MQPLKRPIIAVYLPPRGHRLCSPAAPCVKYSQLYKFYTNMGLTRIKNMRLHFGLSFKILLNYKILAALSNFGTNIAISKNNGVRNTDTKQKISADKRSIYMKNKTNFRAAPVPIKGRAETPPKNLLR